MCSHEYVMKYYEALECIVYETLTGITTQENEITFKLLNISCSTLAKVSIADVSLLMNMRKCQLIITTAWILMT